MSVKFIKFIETVMRNGKVKLTAGENFLAEIKIQRYIPERCTVTITIRNNDDATQSNT